METEKNSNMTRNIAIGIGVAIVVIGFIVFAVAKSKSNVVDTRTSASAQAPVDCKYTWSKWECDNTAKQATRTAQVTTQASGGGLACPEPEIKDCNDCEVTWGDWICDDATGKATRNPLVTKPPSGGGKECPEPEIQDCNDCQYTWGKWECDDATGVATRKAVVSKQASLGGKACPQPETQPCANCKFTWNEPVCDTTTGKSLKSPNITSLALNGGLECPGPETGLCDVDCVVTYPTEWGVCDPATGKQSLTGTVATARQNGGKACEPLVKTQDCKVDCQVEWCNVWGPCNYLTESKGRNGVVAVTAKNGGAACGPLSETQNCTRSGPYVYTTQVFAGQTIFFGSLDFPTQYKSFSQSGIPPGWGPVNFTSYGGLCVIDLNFTAYTTTPNNLGTFALVIDGVAQLPLIKFCFNQAGVHCTVPGVYLSLYLSPGVHTIGLYVNYTPTNTPITVDVYDNIWLRVIEYSQALVGLPNPSVYVTTVFNQTDPGSSAYNQQGIPPSWTKTAITYGGECMIDLNFSAFNKNGNEGVNFALMIDGVVQEPLIYHPFALKDKHQTIIATFRTRSLDAGTHTFAIYISWGGPSGACVDPWDYLNMRITEFNNNLTMSTPKLINVIPVFSMIQPTTSGNGITTYPESPGNWSREFTTNGGTCAFNISTTIYSTIFAGHTMIMFFITNPGSSNIKLSSGTAVHYANNGNSLTINNYYYLNNWSEQVTVNCNFVVSGLPAGSHTMYVLLPMHPGVVVCNHTNRVNVRIIEFSPTLTSGTPPALPAALTASTRPNFKGCYTDGVNSQRVFNQMVSNQSLAQCNTLAKTAESPYFGMQYWQSAGGVTAMDTGECWFKKGSTLQSAQSQGSSTSCVIGAGGYNIGGSNTNAVYQTV